MIKFIPFYADLLDEGANKTQILLYGLIELLSYKEGHCYASNDFLANELRMSKGNVANALSEMTKKGWIRVELDDTNHRTAIYPCWAVKKNEGGFINLGTPPSQKNEPPLHKKMNPPFTNLGTYNINTTKQDDDTSKSTSQVQKWTSETRTAQKKVKVSEEAISLASLLRDEILQQFPNNAGAKNKTCVQRWAVDIDRMIRIDHRTPESVRDAITWAMNDEFWRRNIWSGAKLRKQYDRLDADARAGFLKHGTITVGGNYGKSNYNNPF